MGGREGHDRRDLKPCDLALTCSHATILPCRTRHHSSARSFIQKQSNVVSNINILSFGQRLTHVKTSSVCQCPLYSISIGRPICKSYSWHVCAAQNYFAVEGRNRNY